MTDAWSGRAAEYLEARPVVGIGDQGSATAGGRQSGIDSQQSFDEDSEVFRIPDLGSPIPTRSDGPGSRIPTREGSPHAR